MKRKTYWRKSPILSASDALAHVKRVEAEKAKRAKEEAKAVESKP